MFKTVNDQPTLWDAILPSELLVLPAELARVDALLDDAVFFAPFATYFDAWIGRPSIPMETYLRLMFLKFRYRLGYESLCREVADSISWQRFCRIPFGTRVPHPTTLMKITTRCGGEAVAALNEALLVKAADAKLLRTDRVRADTTVVCADVGYPTDSGLLAQAVGAMCRSVARIKTAGGASRTKARDRRRSVGRRARAIASKLRLRGAQQRDQAQAVVRRITGELADIAEQTMREVTAVIRNARRALGTATGSRRGRLAQAINHLDTIVERTRRLVAQSRSRLAGVMPDSSTRVVSLHDVDARPIRKGRLGKPVEFGYKAQVVDNADGVILDHNVERGNPHDAAQLAPAIERITRRTGRPPRAVTADRGYGLASVERDLHQLGVRSVVIPRMSNPGAARRAFEHRRAFRDKVKWRTGSEGRINHLKRSYGWNRTELTGIKGARTWCGHGVFAHNLVKISTLAA
ncbi:ISNCY-like element ISMav10 family transposase [Mycobacterium avium]|uniref:ISNCY-like element ISMav10 family transposase n=1 Tax=Mycobacterium avium TaxID=1764 RepID=UPI000534E49F|nr:ISNCY-like element ISMav10 family transposase [Mycobacterium avium subsp. hominissuis]ATO67520.3 ISNCY-like element ISMav10 family transposase [Mycobacterium avium subsp. hominissuis]ATO72312.3 ISNCY-like element ISMav10 family transposase [Mycobacterium avium subsp. hominissuis]MCA2338536.1 ISNCY-like element ISMav10 family transposase [Mycobacterium avium]